MEKQSLYELISNAVTAENRLPDEFSLPQSTEGIAFADGAQDGIWIYHSQHFPISQAQKMQMADAVWAVSVGDYKKADELFLNLCKEVPPISFIDDLQGFVIENKSTIPNSAVFQYAVRSISKSSERDIVKTGLILAELFSIPEDDDFAGVIRTMALSDEFSLFCIYIMNRWQHANDEIFGLARSVKGWGRIHAVTWLKPDNDLIRMWLLAEGINNNVYPSYNAKQCWIGSGAANRLKGLPAAEGSKINGPLSENEFHAIRELIYALFDEGPVAGISEIEKPADVLRDFLAAAGRFKMNADDYEVLSRIKKFFEKPKYKDDFSAALCQSLIENL